MIEVNPDKIKKNVGVKRETATRLISSFLERVVSANNAIKEEIPYRITRVILFGSYLSNKKKLGDIDIFIEIEEKWIKEKKEGWIKMYDFFMDKIPSTTFIQSFSNPEKITYRYLKNRSKSFSLHDIREFNYFMKDDKKFKHYEIFNTKDGVIKNWLKKINHE